MNEILTAAGEGPHGEVAPPSLADYDYLLPPELIAQAPGAERDGGRLLVLRRRGAEPPAHRTVRDLPALLRAGDLLVFNDTRVLPARLHGRAAAGGGVELLLVRELAKGVWECLGKPAKRLRAGAEVRLSSGASAIVERSLGGGRYTVGFGALDVRALLHAHGELPLPPYIRRPDGPLPIDAERYQTVFAANEGAIAAPTAGLHFSAPLLAELRRTGVEMVTLTLHVGPATFLPIRDDDVRLHRMEAERAGICAASAAAIRKAKAEGRRVIAVGTTTTRALESLGRQRGAIEAAEIAADCFITPGFEFRVIDGLLTNFHLPRSTLLLLVSAFAGRERVLAAYAEAVRERYRFYSYGDAMLIV